MRMSLVVRGGAGHGEAEVGISSSLFLVSPMTKPRLEPGTWAVFSFPRADITKPAPPRGSLKQQIFIVSGLETRSPKSRCQQGAVPSAGFRAESFLVSVAPGSAQQCPAVLGFTWHSGGITPVSASVVTWFSPCVSAAPHGCLLLS